MLRFRGEHNFWYLNTFFCILFLFKIKYLLVKEILKFFRDSTWNVVGLEMEGAHYQKAIQAASKVRGNIRSDVKVRYAYYASDNPLETGSTLASGGLGESGVRPTYLITEKIINQIIKDNQ